MGRRRTNRHRRIFTIAVVDEACDAELSVHANRCGQGFQFHPQNLTELNHRWVVALEPGDELDVTLTANALYPDSAWQAVEFDPAVIDLRGPRGRETGNHLADGWFRGWFWAAVSTILTRWF